LWLLGAAATLLGLRQAGGVTTLAVTVMLAVPVGFIWAAAIAARMIADLRADLRGLHAQMDSLRQGSDQEPDETAVQTGLRTRPGLGRVLSDLSARGPIPAPPPVTGRAPVSAPVQSPLATPLEGTETPEPEPAGATPDPLPDPDADPGAVSTDASQAASAEPDTSATGTEQPDAETDEADAVTDPPDDAPAALPALAAAFSTTRKRPVSPRPAHSDEEQLALSLGPEAQAGSVPLPLQMVVRALNFPDSEADTAGFQALRTALEDPMTARLVRAAQDVLTLLAEDGIYMDDLQHDRARPEIWRRFAQGERGPGVGVLGGIRDRSSLLVTAGRMRNDPVFRDTTHHFMRQFDRVFVGFEARADDTAIAALAETRTARAFMLIGRVIGLFD
jgi:hypothetical protein